MKRVLLLTLCLLVLPALAQAYLLPGALKACGMVTAWGLFGAPASENPDMICWVDCDGSPVGGSYVDGPKCIQTTGCGKFCFSLSCIGNVVRTGTVFQGKAVYLGGMFKLCGKSIPYELKCSPQQITIIPGIKIDLNNCS